MKWKKLVNEEIDLGEIDARRNSAMMDRKSRDDMYNSEIMFDGKKMTRKKAIQILRAKIVDMEDDTDVHAFTDAIEQVRNAKPGDEVEMPTVDIVKESEGEVTPRIYVGTYAKYNNGSLNGEWVDLTDFAYDYEGFVQHCREIHKDEKDPEFMIQDYEGYPSSMYHEGGLPTEEEFDKIIELSELDDSEKRAYAAYLELGYGDDSIDAFRDRYYGKYEDDDSLGYEAVEQGGMPDNPESYFDYERFGRDLMMDYHQGDPDNTDSEGEPEDPDHYYDNDGYDQGEYHSDAQVAEDYIELLGSIEELGKDTLNNYFDYAAFGRDIRLNDLTESDGYLFWNH